MEKVDKLTPSALILVLPLSEKLNQLILKPPLIITTLSVVMEFDNDKYSFIITQFCHPLVCGILIVARAELF